MGSVLEADKSFHLSLTFSCVSSHVYYLDAYAPHCVGGTPRAQGVGSPGTGVIGACEPPDEVPGKELSALSQLPSPPCLFVLTPPGIHSSVLNFCFVSFF